MKRAGLFGLLALAACAPAQRGEAPRGGPAIVSLNPCTDAILAEVAAPGQLRAISHHSQDAAASSMDLAAAQAFPAAGGSVEEVAALYPDVVVTGTFTPPATLDAFARLGIRVEQVGIAGTVAESQAQVRRLAALAGQPARGEALVGRIEAALVAATPPDAGRPSAIVWQSGGMVPGEGTLIADLLRRTGFGNAAAARGLRQADLLPLEAMLADPPRLILAAGNPSSGEDRMLSHPALARLTSTRTERLDPSLLWCGGPTIIRAANRLAQVRKAVR